MKRSVVKTIVLAAVAMVIGSAGAFAASGHGGMDMGHGGTKAEAGAAMDHSKMIGDLVHESKVEGNKFAYHILDNKANLEKARAKGVKAGAGAENMKSHHLMLYPRGADGKAMMDAKVGYLIVGPDGAKQQVMTMEMTGGYGADVDFSKKGKYAVKVKMVKGSDKFVDDWTYEAK